jgi:hypothetical protein
VYELGTERPLDAFEGRRDFSVDGDAAASAATAIARWVVVTPGGEDSRGRGIEPRGAYTREDDRSTSGAAGALAAALRARSSTSIGGGSGRGLFS